MCKGTICEIYAKKKKASAGQSPTNMLKDVKVIRKT
jgi:hypothetical protein